MADERDVALIEGMAAWTLEELAPLSRALDGALQAQADLDTRVRALHEAGEDADLAPLREEIARVASSLGALEAAQRDAVVDQRLADWAEAELAPLAKAIDEVVRAQADLDARVCALHEVGADADLAPLREEIARVADSLGALEAVQRDGVVDQRLTDWALAEIAPLATAVEVFGRAQAELDLRVHALQEAPAPDLLPLDAAIARLAEHLDGTRVGFSAALDAAVAAGQATETGLAELRVCLDALRSDLDAARPSLEAAAAAVRRELAETVSEAVHGLTERMLSAYTEIAELQRALREIEPQAGPPGPPGDPGSFAQVHAYEAGRIYRAGDGVICHAGHPDRWALAVAEVETYEPPGADCPDWRVLALHGAAGRQGDPGHVGPAGPGFRFRGVYRDGIYEPGDVVIGPSGALFLCEHERIYTACPDTGWRLFLKQGKRGPTGHTGVGIARIGHVDGALEVETTDNQRIRVPLWPEGTSPLLFRGAFNAHASYGHGDVVVLAGRTYLATAANQGLAPNLAPDVWLPLGGRA
jgi:hypothetical protein